MQRDCRREKLQEDAYLFRLVDIVLGIFKFVRGTETIPRCDDDEVPSPVSVSERLLRGAPLLLLLLDPRSDDIPNATHNFQAVSTLPLPLSTSLKRKAATWLQKMNLF